MVCFLVLFLGLGLSGKPAAPAHQIDISQISLHPAAMSPNHIWTGGMFEPEWQTHAKWCTTDKGNAHGAYIATCTQANHDQFDAVIACQAHGGKPAEAQKAIRDAGRAAVNTFMDNWKSPECK